MRGRQCDVRRTLPQLLALEMREGALIQGMGVGSNLEMARKWILPKSLWKEGCSTCHHGDSVSTETHFRFLTATKTIHLHCFKPLILCYFVSTVIEN